MYKYKLKKCILVTNWNQLIVFKRCENGLINSLPSYINVFNVVRNTDINAERGRIRYISVM